LTNSTDYDIINSQNKRKKEFKMAKKMAEIQAEVKATVFNSIKEQFAENGEQYADFSIAVPVEVDGVEYWGKVTVVCGQIKDTASAKAFDPFVVQADWKEDKATKAKLAEAKAKAKEEKLARSKKKVSD
jgi:hypothetical protein